MPIIDVEVQHAIMARILIKKNVTPNTKTVSPPPTFATTEGKFRILGDFSKIKDYFIIISATSLI